MLSYKIRSTLGDSLGFIFSLFPSKEKKIAQLQLSKFLPDKKKTPISITRRIYRNIGKNIFESVNLFPILLNHKDYIKCDSFDLTREWLQKGKGIICLTAHVGNWDLLAAYMIHRGIPLTVIGKESKNPALQKSLEKIRGRYGVKTIWRSDKKAVVEIRNELCSKRVVAGLIDQDTTVTSTISDFLGQPAKTPTALVAIGKKLECPIVYAFIVRTGFVSYDIKLGEIDNTLSVEEIINIYHDKLGEVVKNNPDQWVWFHKRWRTIKEGKTLSSKEYMEYLSNL